MKLQGKVSGNPPGEKLSLPTRPPTAAECTQQGAYEEVAGSCDISYGLSRMLCIVAWVWILVIYGLCRPMKWVGVRVYGTAR